MPKISVCIPVYNPGSFLEPAIESVLAQSFTDYELLVLDDCSDKPVWHVVSKFQDKRVKYFRNESNLGIPANWNRCIELSSGEYVAIFHQDDLMLPGNLHRKAEMLQNYPEVGYVYSDIITINNVGHTTGGHYISQPESDRVLSGCQVYKMVAETGNPIACPAVVMRKKCYSQCGTYDSSLPFATDLEMWLRIAACCSVGFIAEPLIAHRIHDLQEGARFAGTGKDYQDVYRALARTYSRPLPAECKTYRRATFATLAKQSVRMARWKLRQNKLMFAARYFQVASTSILRAFGR